MLPVHQYLFCESALFKQIIFGAGCRFRWRQQFRRRYPDEFLDKSNSRLVKFNLLTFYESLEANKITLTRCQMNLLAVSN